MASLWKHPQSKYWTACFTDHTGKQRKRSTKCTSRSKALKIAETWEEAYRDTLTEVQARTVLSDIYEDIHGKRMFHASVRNYLERWLKRKGVELAPSTVKRYKSITNRFLEYLGNRADKDLSFISSTDIADFRDHVAEILSPASANLTRKVIGTALQDAWRDGYIQENPVRKVTTIKKNGNGSARRSFSFDELKAIVRFASPEWKRIIIFGLYTGQRLGDIVRLTWSSLDLEEGVLRFVTGKTGRTMIIPIAKPLLEIISDLPSSDDVESPLFPEAIDCVERNHGYTNQLSKQFYNILVTAGLAPPRNYVETGEGRGTKRQSTPLSFHSLRHTTTSLLKKAGVSEAIAMDLIGHDSKAISLQYTHIEEESKRTALNKLPDISRES